MHLVIRSQPGSLRSATAFSLSTFIHGGILAWLAFSPRPAPEPRLSLYDMQVKPHEAHIIWYNLRDRLPEVRAAGARRDDPRPPRALRKFDQTLVAGTKENPRSQQMIFAPAPEIRSPKTLSLPNVLAVAPPPKALRAFDPVPKPPAIPPPSIPDAPRVTAAVEKRELPIDAKATRPLKAFTPPPAAKRDKPAVPVIVADAPEVSANQPQAAALPVPDPKAPLRRFTPPTNSAPPTAAPTELPAAPKVESAPAQATLAIASLNPSKAPEFPKPPGSRPADFSAGPELRKKGGNGPADDATIEVPWLTARGGAKDSQPTIATAPDSAARAALLAAARGVPRVPGNPSADTAMPAAVPAGVRVSTAPDPRLDGRAVYSIAIPMPNVTSYSGSWIVWFAERTPLAGAPPPEVRAPVPLHKVDPKYVAEAVQERVEGSVRLFAVIRQDGHVESVSLVRHLDDRLDRSAEEALAKWVFEPALRNGTPMDVEAVFEIPFHLAPKPTRR